MKTAVAEVTEKPKNNFAAKEDTQEKKLVWFEKKFEMERTWPLLATTSAWILLVALAARTPQLQAAAHPPLQRNAPAHLVQIARFTL